MELARKKPETEGETKSVEKETKTQHAGQRSNTHKSYSDHTVVDFLAGNFRSKYFLPTFEKLMIERQLECELQHVKRKYHDEVSSVARKHLPILTNLFDLFESILIWKLFCTPERRLHGNKFRNYDLCNWVRNVDSMPRKDFSSAPDNSSRKLYRSWLIHSSN